MECVVVFVITKRNRAGSVVVEQETGKRKKNAIGITQHGREKSKTREKVNYKAATNRENNRALINNSNYLHSKLISRCNSTRLDNWWEIEVYYWGEHPNKILTAFNSDFFSY